jgi:hypothetical protein
MSSLRRVSISRPSDFGPDIIPARLAFRNGSFRLRLARLSTHRLPNERGVFRDATKAQRKLLDEAHRF